MQAGAKGEQRETHPDPNGVSPSPGYMSGKEFKTLIDELDNEGKTIKYTGSKAAHREYAIRKTDEYKEAAVRPLLMEFVDVLNHLFSLMKEDDTSLVPMGGDGKLPAPVDVITTTVGNMVI